MPSFHKLLVETAFLLRANDQLFITMIVLFTCAYQLYHIVPGAFFRKKLDENFVIKDQVILDKSRTTAMYSSVPIAALSTPF